MAEDVVHAAEPGSRTVKPPGGLIEHVAAPEKPPATDGDEERRQPAFLQWPKLLVGVIAGLAAAAAVIYLFSPHILHDLHQAHLATRQPVYLLFAFLCVLVYLAADAATLVQLVRVLNPHAAWRPVTLLMLRATAIGGVTSFGGVEIPYQAFALRRHLASLTESTSTVLVKAIIHTSILVLVALLAFLPVSGSPITTLQRWLVLGVIALLAVAWLVGSVWVRRPIGLSRLPERLRRRVHAFRDAFAEFHTAGWRVVLSVSLLQLLYWAAHLAIIPLILHALGWRGSLLPIVTSQAVLQVLMPLSPLPGGAGVAELGYLALIGRSLPPGAAVASLVLWRAATWAFPVILGIVAFGLGNSRHDR